MLAISPNLDSADFGAFVRDTIHDSSLVVLLLNESHRLG